jgi:hypothetical protein
MHRIGWPAADPENLREPFVLSTDVRTLPGGAAFTPGSCSAS